MPQCYQSIIVNAPINYVWDAIKNFYDMSWAKNFIETCEAVGNRSGSEAGAQRVLNEVFYETLLECNELEHRIRYTIDDGPPPVSANEIKNYTVQIVLKPITLNSATFVEWSSAWEANTEEARDFCQFVYVVLLKALANQAQNKFHPKNRADWKS